MAATNQNNINTESNDNKEDMTNDIETKTANTYEISSDEVKYIQ